MSLWRCREAESLESESPDGVMGRDGRDRHPAPARPLRRGGRWAGPGVRARLPTKSRSPGALGRAPGTCRIRQLLNSARRVQGQVFRHGELVGFVGLGVAEIAVHVGSVRARSWENIDGVARRRSGSASGVMTTAGSSSASEVVTSTASGIAITAGRRPSILCPPRGCGSSRVPERKGKRHEPARIRASPSAPRPKHNDNSTVHCQQTDLFSHIEA